MATCPAELHPSLMSPKTTVSPHPPTVTLSPSYKPTPPHPRRGRFCPLELSLHEEGKNTAPCEFIASSRVAIENINFFRHLLGNPSKKTERPQRLYQVTATQRHTVAALTLTACCHQGADTLATLRTHTHKTHIHPPTV